MSNFTRRVECYDCHEYVLDLKEHRGVCPRSRKAKSQIRSNDASGSDGGHLRHEPLRKSFMDVYFLIDVSGSMEGLKLTSAKECAKDIIGKMFPLDRLAIVTFDSSAFFKLKPRPVEEILRKNELDGILAPIFARGNTALYDAIDISVSQIRDKTQPTTIIVLTDGEDNASKKTHSQILAMMREYPKLSLNIVHVSDSGVESSAYSDLCSRSNGGQYTRVTAIQRETIRITVQSVIERVYRIQPAQ